MPSFAQIIDMMKAAAPYVEGAGKVASGISANRAAGRQLENTERRAGDTAAQQQYAAEQLAKLNAAQLTELATRDRADRYLTSGKDRAQQVGLGDLLANVQDVELQGMPSYIPKMSFSGGLRPSALGPNARLAGANLSRDALAAQMSGSDVPDLPNMTGIGTDAPELSSPIEAGKLDDVMNLLGYAGQAGGLYTEMERQRLERQRQREEMAVRNRPATPAPAPAATAPPQLPPGAGTDPRLFTGLFDPYRSS